MEMKKRLERSRGFNCANLTSFISIILSVTVHNTIYSICRGITTSNRCACITSESVDVCTCTHHVFFYLDRCSHVTFESNQGMVPRSGQTKGRLMSHVCPMALAELEQVWLIAHMPQGVGCFSEKTKHFFCQIVFMSLSENRVPQDPVVCHHFPHYLAGIPHVQTYQYIICFFF